MVRLNDLSQLKWRSDEAAKHASQADPESECLNSRPGPGPGPSKERQGGFDLSLYCTANLGRLQADASERYSAMGIGYQDMLRGPDTGITM